MSIFWDGLLVSIFSQWRDSEGKQNWVHFPSDPSQLVAEMRLVLQACVVWIAHLLMDNLGRQEVTIDEVLDHWEARAQECSVAFLLLVLARLVFFILEVKATEERNDWKRYQSFYPMFLMLWAAGHCTKYVVITAFEIAFWWAASKAEQALQAFFGFCRLTRFGKWQFADLFMEKRINDMRSVVGKHMRPGMRDLLNSTALNLPTVIARRTELSDRKTARPRRGILLGHPFFMMYEWLALTNVLGKLGSDFWTVPEQNPGGVNESTKTTQHKVNTDEGPVTASNHPMNSDIYEIDKICAQRILPVAHGVLQEEEACKASLFLLGTTLDDASRGDYLEWARDFSTEVEEIGMLVGRSRLIDDKMVIKELKHLYAVGTQGGIEGLRGMIVNAASADARIQQLSAARKIYFSLPGIEAPRCPEKRTGCSGQRARELAQEALTRSLVGKPCRRGFAPEARLLYTSRPSVVTWLL